MNYDSIGRATFIAGFPRSGTTLMTALLDDHHELLVFPEECMYLEHPEEAYRKCQNVLDCLLKNKVQHRLQGSSNFIDEIIDEKRNYKGLNYHLFEKTVNERFKILKENSTSKSSSGSLGLVSLIDSYQASIGKESYSRWVIKNPRYELYWDQLLADFPDMKMILLLRDPRDAILSRLIKTGKKRYLKKGGVASQWKPEIKNWRLPVKFLREWEGSVIEYNRIKQNYPEQVLLVRYEDLVSRPVDVMNKVSDFLAIDWNESLLVPSFLGRPWDGNSAHQQTSSSVNALKAGEKYDFAAHQLWQIEAWIGDAMIKEPASYTLSGILENMNYKALSGRLTGEGSSDFFRNRVRMWSGWRRLSALNLMSHQHPERPDAKIHTP